MKSFVSSLAALFLTAGVIGCGGSADTETAAPPVTPEHEAMMSGSGPDGHGAEAAAEGDAAPAEGDATAPAEGDAAAPAEGDAAAPAEGDAAAPAEGDAAAAPAEGNKTE